MTSQTDYSQRLTPTNPGPFNAPWLRAAAISTPGGQIFEGPRHHMILRDMVLSAQSREGLVEGYVTNAGVFVDKTEGSRIATASGQVKQLIHDPMWVEADELWFMS